MSSAQPEPFFGLPANVVFCRKCVISNQRPSSTVEFKHKSDEKKATIGFSDDGICDACRYQDVKAGTIDWKKREDQLVAMLDRYRRTDGGYDVVVPGSGGKDSAFTSHILKYRYGMNPLTVTWAPHLYTDIGWKNFEAWCHVGGHDNILFTPNGKLHRLLTSLAFKNLLHPFQPFIVGQRIIGPLMAAKFGIELVMYGENQAEYGNNVDDNYVPTMDTKFFTTQDPYAMRLGGVTIADIIKDHGYTINDFTPYIPPSADYLAKQNVVVHYLGYYLRWDPQECYYYAVENTGFQANSERTPGTYSKYSSIDDKIDMFHYYTTLIKFGIGRATYDAAQEVRNGKITREEAVHLVRKYDQEFPSKYYPQFLEYVGMTDAEFWETVDRFRSPHLWEREGNDWKLRHQVA
ncbi:MULTISPECIES: N-acetyl sugar amidotransferase [unclassified Sphingomonas]|uniref:N-acetyl sugar amidotransferase n=1 Tax=unclassified Sphingomonas TaxID=196159 RepID=UPI0006F30233|nr:MULTISPECIES: N-acetyl sugar amidotransferase [unclassified Sphingomonas]KQX19534.1 LPS biosynthesis protein [Sphingomonas sp. Root1294]KQY65735.1 LPS biosynthesis protein [Sphingomonas sp. Root50]KRB94960.1 LPS biosynthesis protein [Sphingomonas sp. Root720]